MSDSDDGVLDIPPAFLRELILKIRGVMAREATDISNPGGNATDDEVSANLQDRAGDLRLQEITEDISALDRDHMHELVALMWIGRGDMDADEWDDALELAEDRHQGPVADYLLSHPQVADYWMDGLDKLYDGTDLLETGEY